mmetsp:Transcript_139221/g.444970  ORF Transcript_139221/g.444970 Transcript_139221/m.444970 type:complete len:252 (-) Transcript_139221:119-874(-)
MATIKRISSTGSLPSGDDVTQKALRQVLKPEHHDLIPKWMSNANPAEKRGIIKLAKITGAGLHSTVKKGSGPIPSAMIRLPNNVPTETDSLAMGALQNLLKAEDYHQMPRWLSQASPEEKRGIVKLGRITESTLIRTIGRPVTGRPEPSIMDVPWHSPKGGFSSTGMRRTASSPGLMQDDYVVPSWMHEDQAEMDKIPKPGGCALNLRDSITIQAMKNGKRNQGTYKLFSGQFDGTTTTATAHSLDALQSA